MLIPESCYVTLKGMLLSARSMLLVISQMWCIISKVFFCQEIIGKKNCLSLNRGL